MIEIKDLLLDLIDWFLDWWALIIIFVICVGLLVCSAIYQEKEKQECKDNGGIVLEHFGGYQCITKEELNSLRGD